ncbi:hypothetical protein [Kitasatospora sp. NPDC093558]|uniref:hypothetical protein n=1 Tax=Kitasatospora sp. NPDC093558 TaxID=3155201 RepID=UPI00341455AA
MQGVAHAVHQRGLVGEVGGDGGGVRQPVEETTAYRPGTRLPDATVGYGTLDPVAAVTASWPTVGHQAAAAEPVVVIPGPDRSGAWRALAVAGGSAGVLVVVVFGGVAGRLGRRRSRA